MANLMSRLCMLMILPIILCAAAFVLYMSYVIVDSTTDWIVCGGHDSHNRGYCSLKKTH